MATFGKAFTDTVEPLLAGFRFPYGQRPFSVVALAYQGKGRVWRHRTLKAAYRTLSSVCGGKLNNRGDYAAVIVTPRGDYLNWTETRAALGLDQL